MLRRDILAAYHPNQFAYAGFAVGISDALQRPGPTLIGMAMNDEGGYNPQDMCELTGGPGWQRNDPTVQADMQGTLGAGATTASRTISATAPG
jgi:S-formylglutathione hydrolase FrmB